jgi:hypothetical protein
MFTLFIQVNGEWRSSTVYHSDLAAMADIARMLTAKVDYSFEVRQFNKALRQYVRAAFPKALLASIIALYRVNPLAAETLKGVH